MFQETNTASLSEKIPKAPVIGFMTLFDGRHRHGFRIGMFFERINRTVCFSNAFCEKINKIFYVIKTYLRFEY